MSQNLNVLINDECARVLRWAELERGYSPAATIEMGVRVLEMIENADEVTLLDKDGNRQQMHEFSPPQVPSDIYDF